jgi:predicted house-cleaning noncanonical NTP pyrophosphatase (MazG superfamily)
MAKDTTQMSNEDIAKLVNEKVAEILSKGGEKTETQLAEEAEMKVAAEKLEEPVEVKIFKDNDKYKDDLFVAVNGVGYKIKRGVYVKIPRKVLMVIDNSEFQDTKTAMMMDEKANEFAEKAKSI